jgi:cellulose synthase (UDP-forming)
MARFLHQKSVALHRSVARRLAVISDRVLTPSQDAARYTELYLPAPPKDDQVYRFFDTAFWRFVWILVTQLAILFGFIMVMRHNVYTTVFGLICLAFMIPHIVDSAYLRLRRRSISLDAHLALKQEFAETAQHDASVDVFLPVCGEEIAVLQNTFYYVKRLDWPGRLTVYVLDDADSAEVRKLASHYGFEYIVRDNRGWMKKAGNLINAFDRSSGEFIAVFDADFAPRPDFLWETLPYMEDRQIGVVQTSQFFNVDKRYNFISRSAGALQEFFFRWVQCQRQLDDAAIVAGTNLIYRRAAVDAAGGFAQTPIGEDVHSGIKLWWAGYKTRYVPLALATGLAPESFNALANQQYRWCRSSMLLMINTHFKDAALTRKQRLCFWAAFLFYMTSALIPITASATGLLMIWFYPAKVHLINYLPLVPGMISTCLIFRTLASIASA